MLTCSIPPAFSSTSCQRNGSHVCATGVRSLFQPLGLLQQALRIRLGLCYLKRFRGFTLKYHVVLSTATNKVWTLLRIWILTCLHKSAFPFRPKGRDPSWSFKWPVRPSSCDNTSLPSPGRSLYLHGSLGLSLGLWTASGIYQHGAGWKMDGSEKSEGRVRLCWKCTAASLGRARKSQNDWQEREQAWSDR